MKEMKKDDKPMKKQRKTRRDKRIIANQYS